jgi:hypothetical protein
MMNTKRTLKPVFLPGKKLEGKVKVKVIFITALIVLMLPQFCYPQNMKVTKVGEWGTGFYNDVVVGGNYAYCAANGAGLDIINIADEANPIKMGNCEIPGIALRIFVSGNYAYVNGGYGHKDFHIIDISNPNAPVLAVTYNTAADVHDITISGNYAYVVMWSSWGDNDFRIFDVSNPVDPKPVGSCKEIHAPSRVSVSGNYAYVNGDYRLIVVDISNPSTPFVTGGYFHETESIQDVVVSGNYVYIGEAEEYDRFGFLKVVDISNPLAPVLLKTHLTEGSIYDIEVRGNYAYLATFWDGLECIDLSNFSIPPGLYFTGNKSKNVSVSGNFAYIADTAGGLQIIDISQSPALTWRGSYNTSGFAYGVVVSGNYAYMADGSNDLQIIDISNPSIPILSGSYRGEPWKYALDVAVSGHYAYLVGFFMGLEVIDISHANAPKLIGSWDRIVHPRRVAVAKKYAYVTTPYSGLVIFDVSNPSSPTVITEIHYSGYAYGIAISGNYAYLTEKDDSNQEGNNLRVINVSNPASPVLKGTYRTTAGALDIDVAGNYAFMAEGETGIEIVDISNPNAPSALGLFRTPGEAVDITVSGKFAFVSTGEEGLQVVDISNPHFPILAGSYDTPGILQKTFVSDKYVYAADGSSGKLLILNIPGLDTHSIILVSPNGGENWPVGTSHYINWTKNQLQGDVNIDLYKGGIFHSSIGTAKASDCKYPWRIPVSLPPGNDYKVRIHKGGIKDTSNDTFSITSGSSPSIALNRTILNFGAAADNVTGIQTVVISNSGGGILNWHALPTESWLEVTPINGTGNHSIQVGVNPAQLTPGTYTGKIVVKGSGAVNSPQEIRVIMKVYKRGSPPFGEILTPLNHSTVSGSIPVTGWAMDDVEVVSIKIYRKGMAGEKNSQIFIGDAVLVEGARPDIEQAYPNYPMNYRAGWGYMLLTNTFSMPQSENEMFIIYAKATDKEGHTVNLGTKTFFCNNAAAVKPFGSIDTPAQGGIASGNNYVNFGWALTPLPNTIPTDGSTILVWVDGIPVGHPIYNQYRSDIASLFPGYNNSNGAAGYYYLDTTLYKDGVHTIAWSVTDDAGNSNGIGSRYFTIQNTGNDTRSGRRGQGGLPPCVSPLCLSPGPLSHEYVRRVDSVEIIKGYSHDGPHPQIYPDEGGIIVIEIKELERVEIRLSEGTRGLAPLTNGNKFTSSHWTGFQVIGNQLRSLPIGSYLDTNNGVFFWQPGPAFIGEYGFVFTRKNHNGEMSRMNINIKIEPIYVKPGTGESQH